MKLGANLKKLLGGRGVATFQPGCTLYILVFCILVPMNSINFTGFRINLIKMFVCCSYSLGVTVNKRVSAAPPPAHGLGGATTMRHATHDMRSTATLGLSPSVRTSRHRFRQESVRSCP